MRIKVRLFAVMADIAKAREIELELPENATGRDLLHTLFEKYPAMAPLERSLKLAVNQEYVPWERRLSPGDEAALIPPVSGGLAAEDGGPFVKVTTEPLSADEYQKRVLSPRCGAVVLFAGVVREYTGDKRTVFLKYDAYREMAEREMLKIAQEIESRWPDARVAIGHRIGELGIGETSVIVAVATPHRDAAFQAARYGIDTLKERVPIWKKEVWEDGESWVGIDA